MQEELARAGTAGEQGKAEDGAGRQGIPAGEEPLRVEVDRRYWRRGSPKPGDTYLLAPNGSRMMCCAGFAARSAGVAEENLHDECRVAALHAGVLEKAHPAIRRLVSTGKGLADQWDSPAGERIYHANDVPLGSSPPAGEDPGPFVYPRTEAEREEAVRAIGRSINVEFTFTH